MSTQRTARVWRGRPDRAGEKGARRPARRRLPGALVRAGLAAAAVLAAAWPSTNQAATRSATPRNRLLSVADLPAGWSAAPTNALKTLQATTSPCLAGLKGSTFVSTAFVFVEGALPNLSEALASGVQARAAWQRFGAALAGCRTATFVHNGTTVVGTVTRLALPRLGRRTSAYALALGSAGTPVGVDLVLFQTAASYGYLSYSNFGSPLVSTVTAFARAAVVKATTGSTAPVPDSVSIASTPVHTVHTTLGTVGYRSIGNGPALVLMVAKIAVPTLVADGTVDRLDPVANSHLLARLIPGARLKLYPDAGHAFLFQDYAAVAALVDSFLGQGRSS